MNKTTLKVVALTALGFVAGMWLINNVSFVAKLVAPKPAA